ncbi:hypothetical protein Y032_0043g783 [Ancylostoma ceylanicum]|uniref:Secreted protein n=1 Tax=Ancylostoma ceylanicum TaxID=53326 RepID=A0A016UEK9_9BILA|nr:hypothetical protein Y032_0043g783 [Ancylostoma ceylanicum]
MYRCVDPQSKWTLFLELLTDLLLLLCLDRRCDRLVLVGDGERPPLLLLDRLESTVSLMLLVSDLSKPKRPLTASSALYRCGIYKAFVAKV